MPSTKFWPNSLPSCCPALNTKLSSLTTPPRPCPSDCLPACRKKAGAYRELAQRQQRQQKLGALAQQMSYDKQVMGKGRKRKLQPEEAGGQTGVFRWKAERKR